MPEDTSDDSSIEDCCRTALVAVRNTTLWHIFFSRNIDCRISYGSALSWCSDLAAARAAALAAAIAVRLKSVQDFHFTTLTMRAAGRKFSAFGAVFWCLPADRFAAGRLFIGRLAADWRWFWLQSEPATASARDGGAISRAIEIMTLRAQQALQLCHPFLQQKF